MKVKGSKFHPARISGRQKFLRQKQWEEDNKKETREMKSLDLKKQDWSLKN